MRNPNRVSAMLMLAIACLGLTWILISTYAVPPIIKSAYDGESLPVLNRLISGQASHAVTEYLSSWDSFRWRLLIDFSLVSLLVLLVIRPEFKALLGKPAVPIPEDFVATPYSTYLYISLTILTASLLLCIFLKAATGLPFGILFYDAHDLRIFFNSSAWTMGKGKLYLDVRSEYPILANLIFGVIRFLSFKITLLGSDFDRFSVLWIICTSVAFACLLTALPKGDVVWGAWLLLLLLSPATIYFSLLRYDIYPVLFSFWGLSYLLKREWNVAALLLGVCIALKGYALILIPAFFVFCIYQIGIRAALVALFVMLLPSLVSNFAVFIWGGERALLAPYKLQVFRGFNGESSFDSLFFIGSRFGMTQDQVANLSSWLMKNHIPKIIQSAIALGACLFKPARFESFVNVAFLSVLGFITFSSFYSPQYVIWLIPFLLFTRDRVLLFLAIFLAWSSYIYFPVTYDLRLSHPTSFAVSILVATLTRFLMLAGLIRKLRDAGTAQHVATIRVC